MRTDEKRELDEALPEKSVVLNGMETSLVDLEKRVIGVETEVNLSMKTNKKFYLLNIDDYKR